MELRSLRKKILAEHLRLLEEAKERDHRKIGKELNLFTSSQLVGQGCHYGFQKVQQFAV